MLLEKVENHLPCGDRCPYPFIGSGTTAVAAVRLNRRHLGAEISKEYFELAQEAILRERG